MDSTQQLVEIRREEAATLFATARAHLARSDQLLALAGAAGAAVVGLAIKDGFEQVMLGVPAALFLVLSWVTQVYTDVTVMSIARKRIEDVLEEQLGESALIYESFAASYRAGPYLRGPLAMAVAVACFAAGVTVAGAIIAARRAAPALVLYSVATAIAFTAAAAAALDFVRVRRDAPSGLEEWPHRLS